ncbi:MAG: peptidylprolyl isomerase [Kiritimatiellia bacterium]|nr:peptidylprolyl isomerase [Kiritimatiellia bacterium]
MTTRWMTFGLSTVAGLAVAALSVQGADETAKPFQVDSNFYDSPLTAPAQAAPADPVVVTVNGDAILQSDVIKAMQGLLRMVGQQIPPDRREQAMQEIQQRAIDNLIANRLLLSEARQQKITVPAEQVQQEIAQLETRLPTGRKLDEELQAQGVTRAELTREIEGNLKINQLLQKNVGILPPVEDAEIQAFYDGNPDKFLAPETASAHHILLKTEATDSEAVKRKKKAEAEALARILKDGGDFEQLAKSRSECPSRERGGDLGSFGRGQMVPEFEKAAFSQPIGEVGSVVETQFGYHVIRVDKREPARKIDIADVREQVRQFLANQRQQQAVGHFIRTLRDKATLEAPNAQPAAPAAL